MSVYIHSDNTALPILTSQQARTLDRVDTGPGVDQPVSSLLVGIIYTFAVIAIRTTTKFAPLTRLLVNEMKA